MKACDTCSNRVEIGKNHNNMSVARRLIGLFFVYLPIVTLPFVFASAYMTYFHLWLVGAKNVKKFSDYLPAKESHRYTMKNQITMKPSFGLSLSQYKLYWILNCTWYCPVSVAVFEWHTYLVKLVENWWCPFAHDKKENYSNAKIDKSFWHIYPHDIVKLAKEDRDNPIWNDEADENAN
jgi:hypothetical protein